MRYNMILSQGAALLALIAPIVSADCCSCPNNGVCSGGSRECIPFASCCGVGSWQELHWDRAPTDCCDLMIVQQYFLLQL